MAPALLRHQFENDAGFAVTFDAEHDAFIDPLHGGYVCTLPSFRDGPPISGVSEIGVVSYPGRQHPTWVAGPGIYIHDRWLWIPGSSRSLSSGRPLRAGPVGSAPE